MREDLFSWLSNLRPIRYGASSMVFDPQGRMLLVRHRLRGGWEWPAGGANFREQPHQTVIRETFEEARIKLAAPRLVGVYAASPRALPTRINFTFTEQVTAEQASGARYDRFELKGLRWETPEQALEIIAPRLRRRLAANLEALKHGQVAYLSDRLP